MGQRQYSMELRERASSTPRQTPNLSTSPFSSNNARATAPVTGRDTRYGALHPLWTATPVMSRCTRSEGVHCLQIGCSAPNHKNKRGIRETTADTTARGSRHPLRGTAPVMDRDTRSEGVHCLQIGCSAPNHKNKRGICETTADTQKVGERTKRVGLWRLFGLSVRKSWYFSRLGPAMRMDKTCWFCGDFSACWCGTINIKRVSLFQAAGHRARGAPPALDVGSGAGPVCIVAAESKRVCATSLLTQWCPAWRCARPWASSVGRTGSGRACGVGSGVQRDGCAV